MFRVYRHAVHHVSPSGFGRGFRFVWRCGGGFGAWLGWLPTGRSLAFARFRRLALEGVDSLLKLCHPGNERVDRTQLDPDLIDLVAEVVARADDEAMRKVNELSERVLARVGQSRDRVALLP